MDANNNVVESVHDLPNAAAVGVAVTGRGITGDTIVSQADQHEKMTPAQEHDMRVWMKAAKDARGKSRRKVGASHCHNPAGSKLSRKLEDTGNIYGRNGIVYQTFVDMRAQAYKNKGTV